MLDAVPLLLRNQSPEPLSLTVASVTTPDGYLVASPSSILIEAGGIGVLRVTARPANARARSG